ncbi:MAG: N-6 DNA methylase [Conexivisphaerales archaeon]
MTDKLKNQQKCMFLDNYHQSENMKKFFIKGINERDLRTVSFDELTKKFQMCHDAIWEGGKRDPATAFDEFSKLLMSKIYDERFTSVDEEYKFQIKDNETSPDVAEKIKKLYEKVKEKNSKVFKTDIKLSPQVIFEIVKTLQGISLRFTDLDVKGRAFEKFLGKIFRDEYGQYFTPRNVVKFMVELLDPDEDDLVIDPACGSGGFLLYTLMHVIKKLSNRYNEDSDSLNRISWDFAHKQIFGIEINDRIARIAMMDMIIHEDGHSNIECNNALLDYNQFDKKHDIRPDKYSLIFTNPPFGAIIKDTAILNKFELGKGRDNQKTEILFIERCIDLLRDGGKLGIVLPDSILTNTSLQYVRDFILNKCKILAVISLPQHAFVPSGASVKSSLLFLEKTQYKKNYKVFMAVAKHIGFDARGEDDKDDLIDIINDWEVFRCGNEKLKKSFIVGNEDLITNFSPDKFIFYSNNKNWQTKTLLELCDGEIFTGKTPPRKLYTNSGHKILKVRDLTNKGIDWDNNERAFVSENFFEKNQNIELQENDILIISAAHHPKYIGQKVDIIDSIPERYKNGVLCSAEIMVIRVNPMHIDPYYVLLFLKTNDGYKSIQSCIRGQTAHIYPKDIKNIKIPIPPKNEYIEREIENIKNSLKMKTDLNEEYIRSLTNLMKFMAKEL